MPETLKSPAGIALAPIITLRASVYPERLIQGSFGAVLLFDLLVLAQIRVLGVNAQKVCMELWPLQRYWHLSLV